MEDQATAPPPAVAQEGWPFLRRLAAAFASPRALFEHLAARPSWFAPFLLVLVLVVVFIFVLWDPVMLPEQLARAEDMGRDPERIAQFMNTVGRVFIPATGVLFAAGTLLVFSAFVQLVGGFFLGGALSYRQALSIVTHASLVGLPGFLLRLPLALIAKTSQVTVGPGMLYPMAQAEGFGGRFLAGLLGGLDVFALWQTALIALGVSVVARVPAGKANAGIWTLFAATIVLGALIAAVFGGMGAR